MVAGIIDHETGTRHLTKLGGLRSAMPLTFAIALAAALSMGGLPPFSGSLRKRKSTPHSRVSTVGPWSSRP